MITKLESESNSFIDLDKEKFQKKFFTSYFSSMNKNQKFLFVKELTSNLDTKCCVKQDIKKIFKSKSNQEIINIYTKIVGNI